jgi:hypothetical protein
MVCKIYIVGDEFKYHLVKWSKVCTPVSEGGLGIRNLVVFNKALEVFSGARCFVEIGD